MDRRTPTPKNSEPVATTAVAPRHVSLEGMHSTVEVPHHGAGFWQQWRAFIGPAILVSVGYMDPGNWGTDLAGGAQYKYGLLWVVGLASVMAIFMQVISARLGVVTGKDLAQCCRDWYPRWTRWPNWLMSDSAAALTVTFFVNAAILVLAAMVFFGKESVIMSGGQVVSFTASSDWIRVAYLTLSPLLGTAAASTLFAVALLASGQSSTITG